MNRGMRLVFGRESSIFKEFMEIGHKSEIQASPGFRKSASSWKFFTQTAYGDLLKKLDQSHKKPMKISHRDFFLLNSYYSLIVDTLLEEVCRRTGIVLKESSSHTVPIAGQKRFLAMPHCWTRQVTDPEIDIVKTKIRTEVIKRVEEFGKKGEHNQDVLKSLFEDIFPRELRYFLGEFYTPLYLAEAVLADFDDDDFKDAVVLDPGCGSGIFLTSAIRRKIRMLHDECSDTSDIVRHICETVIGIDINPVAAISARTNYLLSMYSLIKSDEKLRLHIPVYHADSIDVSGLNQKLGVSSQLKQYIRKVDIMIGNPPWVSWGHLTEDLRASWRDRYAEHYNLMAYSGKEALLGHSNDDISVPFIWVAMDRYLKHGGYAGFVLKRTLLRGPAGKLFRSLKISHKGKGVRPLRIHHIQDWYAVHPFGQTIGSETLTVKMQVDEDNEFPVKCTVWEHASIEELDASFSLQSAMEVLQSSSSRLFPIATPASPWIEESARLPAKGECMHEIRHGAKDDLKAVYGLDKTLITQIEPDHIYPYLRSRDIVRWGNLSYAYRLIPQKKAGEDNVESLKTECPRTYDYLTSNRDRLTARKSVWLKSGPFYSVFGVGPYTWSRFKVAWCRLGFRPEFCVVSSVKDPLLEERPLIPGDHFMFIPTDCEDEAHFLCALLNSTPYKTTMGAVSHRSKSALSRKVMSHLHLPLLHDAMQSKELARLSKIAHDLVSTEIMRTKARSRRQYCPPEDLQSIEEEIDSIVYDLLGIDPTWRRE